MFFAVKVFSSTCEIYNTFFEVFQRYKWNKVT